MTSLTLSLVSSREVAQLLRFLYESSVSYTIAHDSICISSLIKAIEEKMINPAWMKHSGMKSIVDALEKTSKSESIRVFIAMVRGFDINSFNVELVPTEHFKAYCGPEWVNKYGLITKRDAVEFIEYNIAIQKLKEVDGIITTNQWLQELLQEYRPTIYRQEIPNLVHRFFRE